MHVRLTPAPRASPDNTTANRHRHNPATPSINIYKQVATGIQPRQQTSLLKPLLQPELDAVQPTPANYETLAVKAAGADAA
jgi:hypothetical protein